MDYLYTLLKFVAGGSIIVGVTVLSENMGPRYGGLLAAAPIITTLSFLFTYYEAGQETTRQLVLGTFFFVIPILVFLIALWYLMDRFGFLQGLLGALGVWGGAILVVNRLVAGV